MKVICTDGTTFTCQGYELTEYGVVIYGQKLDPDDERYAGDPDQAGYVPHDRLWYILPDDVDPNVQGIPAAQSQFDDQPPQGELQPPARQQSTPPVQRGGESLQQRQKPGPPPGQR